MNASVVLMLVLASAQPSAWVEVHRSDDLVVFTRPRAGSAVNEMRAVGIVDAPAEALWAVVRDVEGHTRLLPDTTVSRVMRTEGDTAIVLQRSEPRVLDPREYVIAVREAHHQLPDGRDRRTLSWRTAPRYAGFVHDDAVRIDVNEGFWAVEPLRDGRSQVTFQVLFDPAGFVPAAIVNLAQTAGAAQALAVLKRAARAHDS